MRDVEPLPGMIGSHPSMSAVYALVRRAAPSSLPIVITGETGTGKELIARALHALGPGEKTPFVDVNCAALPEALAEAELFGWERGAFTGATSQNIGLLEMANGGTLFLDEACSLPLNIQAKLLRVIELHEFRRVGGRSRRCSSFRLVVALSAPLRELVDSGRMRSDFAYRIAGVSVVLPALRERRSDIPALVSGFLARRRNAERSPTLSGDALELLTSLPWTGNVRELRTVVERIACFSDAAVVDRASLMQHVMVKGDPQAAIEVVDEGRGGLAALLERQNGDVSAVARELGISRTTVYRRLRVLGLQVSKSCLPALACRPAHRGYEPL